MNDTFGINTTALFNDRADAYAKYRPTYPSEAIAWLIEKTGVTPQSQIADIGAGTGKFAQLLLERGMRVCAVEPGAAMRGIAAHDLGAFEGFSVSDGGAEETKLQAESIDLITVAEAFRWFDKAKSREEFRRILKPDGSVALVWNVGNVWYSDFTREFLETRKRLRDAERTGTNKPSTRADIDEFFGGTWEREGFFWARPMTFEELWGYTLSHSDTVSSEHPNYEILHDELRALFARHEENGVVLYAYRTDVVIGRL